MFLVLKAQLLILMLFLLTNGKNEVFVGENLSIVFVYSKKNISFAENFRSSLLFDVEIAEDNCYTPKMVHCYLRKNGDSPYSG